MLYWDSYLLFISRFVGIIVLYMYFIHNFKLVLLKTKDSNIFVKHDKPAFTYFSFRKCVCASKKSVNISNSLVGLLVDAEVIAHGHHHFVTDLLLGLLPEREPMQTFFTRQCVIGETFSFDSACWVSIVLECGPKFKCETMIIYMGHI